MRRLLSEETHEKNSLADANSELRSMIKKAESEKTEIKRDLDEAQKRLAGSLHGDSWSRFAIGNLLKALLQ